MFIWSAVAHLIALTSPGPDTAIVVRQVSLYGRAEGYKVAIGIGIGIYIHCLLAVNGMSLFILSNELYKLIISLIGGIYILYLGISMFISRDSLKNNTKQNIKNRNSILVGLITNIFNVKAFLFFVSIFTILIDSLDNSLYYIFPVYFAITSWLWFSFLSYIMTASNNKTFNIYSNKYISALMALILCLIGLVIFIRSAYEYF
tara:strand:+ start:7352 stop:7960 length:609 start_codon:yes stop_codon:yes gene_type:complete